jgi:hypothetical protein
VSNRLGVGHTGILITNSGGEKYQDTPRRFFVVVKEEAQGNAWNCRKLTVQRR